MYMETKGLKGFADLINETQQSLWNMRFKFHLDMNYGYELLYMKNDVYFSFRLKIMKILRLKLK